VAANDENKEALSGLLRFHSTTIPDQWSSLDEYIENMKPGQERIYYILGDDENSVYRSPHLDYFQTNCYEVLTLTDPVDSFLLLGLRDYKDFQLQNVADSELDLPEQLEDTSEDDMPQEPLEEDDIKNIVSRFKNILGEKVADVQVSDRMTNSIARLIDAKGSLGQEMQRVYRLMDKDYEIPKKILEINPSHPLMKQLLVLPEDHKLSNVVIEQVFESTLLIEGLHPDPASMIPRIQELMISALENKE
jgi:molecular chaperone HtpG